jgi:hypothetical protein
VIGMALRAPPHTQCAALSKKDRLSRAGGNGGGGGKSLIQARYALGWQIDFGFFGEISPPADDGRRRGHYVVAFAALTN